MRKLLNNPYISGALALLAIVFVVTSVMSNIGPRNVVPMFDPEPEVSADDAQDPSAPSIAAATFNPTLVNALAQKEIERNPFERQATLAQNSENGDPSRTGATTIRVKGVWIQNNIRYVVIDDTTLQAGQSLDRVRVERIEDQGVWIAANDETHFIRPGQSWTYQYPLPNDSPRN